MELHDLELREVSSDLAKRYIIKYHYSHICNQVVLAVGHYFKDELVNLICFNYPTGRLQCQEVIEGGSNANVMELSRMISLEPKPKNCETYCISRALRYLKKKMPNIEVVISYADNEMGHHGYCYQACNFIYYGESVAHDIVHIDGKRVHTRTIFNQYNTNSIVALRKILGKSPNGEEKLTVKKGFTKNRYYIVLANDKRERRDIEKRIKVKSFPYPKGDNSRYDLDTITEFTNTNTSDTKLDDNIYEYNSLFD